MGNRAVITTQKGKLGIYLHWNGGRDSIEAFLKYCELKGYRKPEDNNYGWARLCQVVCNYLDGGLSVGIDTLSNLDCDNGDNGMYIIKDWKIVGRKYFGGEESDEHEFHGMLRDINKAQPECERLEDVVLNAAVKGE